MELPESIIGLKWEWFKSEHFGAFISNRRVTHWEYRLWTRSNEVFSKYFICHCCVPQHQLEPNIYQPTNLFYFFLFPICCLFGVFLVHAVIIDGSQGFVFSTVQSEYWFSSKKHHDDIKERKIGLYCSITLYPVPLITTKFPRQETFQIFKVDVLQGPSCMCVSVECVGV